MRQSNDFTGECSDVAVSSMNLLTQSILGGRTPPIAVSLSMAEGG